MSQEPITGPGRRFYLVSDKVAEADFFLEKLKNTPAYSNEFDYYLSAFVSASRSITFALQAVMSRLPEFERWYAPRQQRLRDSELASYFVQLRNTMQKIGIVPVDRKGFGAEGKHIDMSEFVPTPGLLNPPPGRVPDCCQAYLRLLLEILAEWYTDFGGLVDPRALFTVDGSNEMGWSVEDLEEALGFPRGYTNVEWTGADKEQHRLSSLRRYGPDDLLSEYLRKYQVDGLGAS